MGAGFGCKGTRGADWSRLGWLAEELVGMCSHDHWSDLLKTLLLAETRNGQSGP